MRARCSETGGPSSKECAQAGDTWRILSPGDENPKVAGIGLPSSAAEGEEALRQQLAVREGEVLHCTLLRLRADVSVCLYRRLEPCLVPILGHHALANIQTLACHR